MAYQMNFTNILLFYTKKLLRKKQRGLKGGKNLLNHLCNMAAWVQLGFSTNYPFLTTSYNMYQPQAISKKEA